MNAVGKFGVWIVEHQLGLETFLLILLGVMILAILVQLIRRERRKKTLLEELDRKIDGISERIEGIAGRISTENHQEESVDKVLEETKTKAEEEIATEAEEEAEAEETAEDHASVEMETRDEVGLPEEIEEVIAPEDAIDEAPVEKEEALTEDNIIAWLKEGNKGEESIPPVSGNQSIRFYSRDWGTDKHGNVYTEEMLREQIG